MKHLLLFSFLLCMAFVSQAQTITKQVVASTGQALSSTNFKLSYTVGESIVGEINNETTLHQGFWSELNSDETLSIETLVEETESITIFPNPVVTVLQIKLKLGEVKNYHTELYAVNGKQVFQIHPIPQDQIISINMDHLSSGMYLLKISNSKTNYNKSFKILKQ